MYMCHGSQNFGRLKFPNYDEIFFVIREHTVHVFDFYETCWYTTYYWIRHAARQVLPLRMPA